MDAQEFESEAVEGCFSGPIADFFACEEVAYLVLCYFTVIAISQAYVD